MLVASVITVVALPLLVLARLEPAPATVGVAVAENDEQVVVHSPAPSDAGTRLGAATHSVLAMVADASTDSFVVVTVSRMLGGDVVDPVDTEGRSDVDLVESTTTLPQRTQPRPTVPPTTTTAPPTTVPPTTTTAPPTTVPTGQTIFGHPYKATWPVIAMWDQMSICESGGNWSIDTGNGYYGGLQFSQGTWEWVGGQGSPAAASREEQIYRALMLWESQGWSPWPGCTRHFGWDKWQTTP